MYSTTSACVWFLDTLVAILREFCVLFFSERVVDNCRHNMYWRNRMYISPAALTHIGLLIDRYAWQAGSLQESGSVVLDPRRDGPSTEFSGRVHRSQQLFNKKTLYRLYSLNLSFVRVREVCRAFFSSTRLEKSVTCHWSTGDARCRLSQCIESYIFKNVFCCWRAASMNIHSLCSIVLYLHIMTSTFMESPPISPKAMVYITE